MDSFHQDSIIQQWAAVIQTHISAHKYEIMREGETRGNAGTVELTLPTTPPRTIEVNLNRYIDLFSRDDPVLRAFAGVKRAADDWLPMDDSLEKWYQTRAAQVGTVATVASTMFFGVWSDFATSLRRLGSIASDVAAYNASLVANNSSRAILLAQQAKLQSLGTMANATKVAQLTTQIAEFNATIANQTAQLEQSLVAAKNIQESFGWAERLLSVIPESVHTAVSSATHAADAMLKHVGMTGHALLVLGSGAAIGGIAYYLYRHRARSAYSRINLDRAADKIAQIALVIATRTMDQFRQTYQSRTEDDFRKALQQQRTREFEHSEQMMALLKQHMEMQRQNQFMVDQMTLTALIQQYRSLGVDPFQLLVYIGSQVKNRTLDANAAREVMTKFAYAGDYWNAPGELMQNLVTMYDTLKQSSQGAAISADTRNQKESAAEKLKQVDRMIQIVNDLRKKKWSLEAISAVDWDEWVNQLNQSGVLTTLQQKVYQFRAENGHSLQMPTTLSTPVTREQQAIIETREHDTTFTGGEAVEDHARSTLAISYLRNTFEPDDGKDMWRERDIPLDDRPELVPDGFVTVNAERAVHILENALIQTSWLHRPSPQVPNRAKFNSYQALWLYRWMGPACSRWLSPEEEKSRGTETMPRPRDPNDKRRRTDAELVRRVPVSVPVSDKQQTLAFVSDLCRRRFAFLKAMLAHSILFLFVRPEEALKLVQDNGRLPSQSCVYKTLERLRAESTSHGRGFGILILDNRWPGYVRVVGLTEGGNTVNVPLNVSDLVDLSVDPHDSKRWKFNHQQILFKTVMTAYNLNVQLVSNVCWKNKNANYAETRNVAEMAQYLNTFPAGDDVVDLRAFRDAQYLYEQSKSAALLTYLTMKNEDCRVAIERARLRYYRNTQGTQDLDRRLATIGDLWRDHRAMQNRDGSYSEWNSSRIDTFRQLTPADGAFVEAATKALIYNTTELKDLGTFTTQTLAREELWEKMFEKAGYRQCEKMPVIVLNTLCVNPFALCIYEKPAPESPDQTTRVHRVFGDLWFLQPLIRELMENTKWGFSLKRFMEIQNWHRDGTRRTYLQDSLYLDQWASFLGIRQQ